MDVEADVVVDGAPGEREPAPGAEGVEARVTAVGAGGGGVQGRERLVEAGRAAAATTTSRKMVFGKARKRH